MNPPAVQQQQPFLFIEPLPLSSKSIVAIFCIVVDYFDGDKAGDGNPDETWFVIPGRGSEVAANYSMSLRTSDRLYSLLVGL